ncbi:MAG: hypothetical protein HQK49_16535 [Oligoflexia bacterium]|nr:hypothetical protein [Oligoflexia bacterium]
MSNLSSLPNLSKICIVVLSLVTLVTFYFCNSFQDVHAFSQTKAMPNKNKLNEVKLSLWNDGINTSVNSNNSKNDLLIQVMKMKLGISNITVSEIPEISDAEVANNPSSNPTVEDYPQELLKYLK